MEPLPIQFLVGEEEMGWSGSGTHGGQGSAIGEVSTEPPDGVEMRTMLGRRRLVSMVVGALLLPIC